MHKNLYIYLFFTSNIWSYLKWPPRNSADATGSDADNFIAKQISAAS